MEICSWLPRRLRTPARPRSARRRLRRCVSHGAEHGAHDLLIAADALVALQQPRQASALSSPAEKI